MLVAEHTFCSVSWDNFSVQTSDLLYKVMIQTCAADEKKLPTFLRSTDTAVTTQRWKHFCFELQIHIIIYLQQPTDVSKQCFHKFTVFAAVTLSNEDELWILNISHSFNCGSFGSSRKHTADAQKHKWVLVKIKEGKVFKVIPGLISSNPYLLYERNINFKQQQRSSDGSLACSILEVYRFFLLPFATLLVIFQWKEEFWEQWEAWSYQKEGE